MSLKKLYSGKVRDIYDAGNDQLLMVASDRISAFDVVFDEPIPDKGRVLTAMTAFWNDELSEIAPTHLISTDPASFPPEADELDDLAGRTMLVWRATMLPIECIVRGYITGSAWKEYESNQTMHGTPLPAGLLESDRLPEPTFTPSTKALEGHDQNISFEQAVDLLGAEQAAKVRELVIEAYVVGSARALSKGIIIADTKFEFGMVNGKLSICDEILTPDSSRFWPAEAWKPGVAPPSFDKQPVRDWSEQTGWDKASQPPAMPESVVQATRDRYITAYERISGLRFSDWLGVANRGHS